ncbi:unnamed protein product [Parascedosporium putredinis]|uniref:Uncharacterized protein n=1 Tax=Parascedosporium putredinis TaxID=1442378 RepID=A0A9P1H2M1_9PEZI|nr:unnamed protein product [Parascedosporium putredinis]CAI7996203.1 unnamed protein product [Parascedosporium putredinis]
MPAESDPESNNGNSSNSGQNGSGSGTQPEASGGATRKTRATPKRDPGVGAMNRRAAAGLRRATQLSLPGNGDSSDSGGSGGTAALPGPGSKGNSTPAIVASVTVIVVVLLLLLIFLFRYRRTKKDSTMAMYGRRDRTLFALRLKQKPGNRSSTVMGGLLNPARSSPDSPTFGGSQPAMVERPNPVAQRRISAASAASAATDMSNLPSPTSTVFGGTISMFPFHLRNTRSQTRPPIPHRVDGGSGTRPQPRTSVGAVSQLSRPSEIRVSFSDVSGFSDTASSYRADMYATHPTWQPDAPVPGPPRLNSIRRHTEIGEWNITGSGNHIINQVAPGKN